MSSILVILTLDMDNLPDNFAEILKEEQAMVARWREQGILEHLFLRQAKNGAVLIFKETSEENAKALMETLPFYQIRKSIEYLGLMKQF